MGGDSGNCGGWGGHERSCDGGLRQSSDLRRGGARRTGKVSRLAMVAGVTEVVCVSSRRLCGGRSREGPVSGASAMSRSRESTHESRI